MKLADLLPKLAKNDTFDIVIAEKNNRGIVTLNPAGFSALSSELMDRTVDDVILSLNGNEIIKIYLEELEEEPGDPNNTGDPTGGD